MKPRPIKELLQIVLDELQSIKEMEGGYYICCIISKLWSRELISAIEWGNLLEYMDENRPDTERAKKNIPVGIYAFWDGLDRESRIEYLEKHIKGGC